jgi:hypothetical protein
MPWQVGIDEAGYAPNLGPFVMTMVTATVPESRPPVDFWQLLACKVRRASGPDDGRLIVDDSKAVYSRAKGIASLEKNLCPFVWDLHWALAEDYQRGFDGRLPFECLWKSCCDAELEQLNEEPWWSSPGLLPVSDACPQQIRRDRDDLRSACVAARGGILGIRSIVVHPRQFNQLIAEHDSKAAVSMLCLERLLAALPSLCTTANSGCVFVDKLGGRDRYYELVQSVFDPCPVLVRGEAEAASRYQAQARKGTWEISIEPRADSRYFVVALASMFGKYLREVLMLQFNRFWQQHVPGLAPTAGYPGDARRFYKDIAKARRRLGIADGVLWRVR